MNLIPLLHLVLPFQQGFHCSSSLAAGEGALEPSPGWIPAGFKH